MPETGTFSTAFSTHCATMPLADLSLRIKYDEYDAQVALLCICKDCRRKTEDCQKRFSELGEDNTVHVNGCEITKRVNDVVLGQEGAYVIGSHSDCGHGIIDVRVPATVSYADYKKLRRRILYGARRSKKAAQKN